MISNNVINIIKYVKKSGKVYSATNYDIGYHSIKIDDNYYIGQRDCIQRIDILKKEYDFKNKNILDIGCCIGGMVFPLADEINTGCGIDFNYRNINAGNIIKQYKKINNLSFYVFDLDKEDLNMINDFIPKIDVVFLFAVCAHIKNWKDLIDFISKNTKVLFIETNGAKGDQLKQVQYCKQKFNFMKVIYKKSMDDKITQKRSLYLFKNK